MAMANELGGFVTIGNGIVSITSGGHTYSVNVPGIDGLGINSTGNHYHTYSQLDLVGPTSNFHGPGGIF
jgi:hypothetical protein